MDSSFHVDVHVDSSFNTNGNHPDCSSRSVNRSSSVSSLYFKTHVVCLSLTVFFGVQESRGSKGFAEANIAKSHLSSDGTKLYGSGSSFNTNGNHPDCSSRSVNGSFSVSSLYFKTHVVFLPLTGFFWVQDSSASKGFAEANIAKSNLDQTKLYGSRSGSNTNGNHPDCSSRSVNRSELEAESQNTATRRLSRSDWG